MLNEKLCDLLVDLGADKDRAQEACSEEERWRKMELDIQSIKAELRDQRFWFEGRWQETKNTLAEWKQEQALLVAKIGRMDGAINGLKSDMAKVLAWIEKHP